MNQRVAVLDLVVDHEPGAPPHGYRGHGQDADFDVRAPRRPLQARELLAVLVRDRGVIRGAAGPAENRLGNHKAEGLGLVVKEPLPLDPVHDPRADIGRLPGRARREQPARVDRGLEKTGDGSGPVVA